MIDKEKQQRDKPSNYMQRKFLNDFKEGLEFWTGEDGEPASMVALRTPEGIEIIKARCDERDIDFDSRKLKERFAYRASVGSGDDRAWQHIRKVWMTQNQETPFPVYELEYYS